MKNFYFSIFILFALAVFFLPSLVSAVNTEEEEGKIIELSLSVARLQSSLEDMLYSLPPFLPQKLNEYLKSLFEQNDIVLQEDDFLASTDNPYLDFAKMLNLIPTSSFADRKVNQYLKNSIEQKFYSIKQGIVVDGFSGKIDMHEHYWAGGDVGKFLDAAGRFGVSKVLFAPTGSGPNNQNYRSYQKFLVEYVKKLYPDKVIAFCTIDEQDPNAAEVFEECLKAGGQGLKILGGHPNFYDEPLDSPNMYKVYQKADEYDVPVLMHASIISMPRLKLQLEKVYSDFPGVTFIYAHYCSTIYGGINLDKCADFLDAYPNLYIDISMGGGIARYHKYLRQDLGMIKDFISRYQDRILFGSDIILDKADYKTADWIASRIKCDLDLHQKTEYKCDFGEKDWIHQGFQLDKNVLRKLYWENPRKIFNW